MRLTLTNFRCHSSLKVSFDNGKIVLINGRSGIGKSTIFDAIYWCLYKRVPPEKSLTVAPRTGKHLKTTVKLELDHMVITRTTKPATLIVNFDGESLTGVSAQSHIEEQFGSSEYWLATSYIIQKEQNPLLSGPQTVKNELIRRLCLDKDDPELFIIRGKEELKKMEGYYDGISKKFNDDIIDIRKNMEKLNITDDDIKNPPEINKEYLEALNEELDQKKVDLVKLTDLLERKNRIKESIYKEWKDTNISDYLKKMVALLEQWELYSNYESHQKYRNHLEKQISDIKNQLKQFPDDIIPSNMTPEEEFEYNDKEIMKNRDQERLHSKYSQTAEKIEVEYSLEAINDTRASLKERIDLARHDQNANRERDKMISLYESLQKKIEKCIIPDLGEDIEMLLSERDQCHSELQEAQILNDAEIVSLKEMVTKSVIKCPHCDKWVYYQRGRLEKTPNVDTETLKKELIKCQQEKTSAIEKAQLKLNNVRKRLEKAQKDEKARLHAQMMIETYKEQLKEIIIPEEIINEDIDYLDILCRLYEEVMRMEWIELPTISSSEMVKHNQSIMMRKLKIQYDELNNKIVDLPKEVIDKPPLSKAEIERNIKRAEKSLEKQKEIDSFPPKIETEIKYIEIDIEDLKIKIKDENENVTRINSIARIKKDCDNLSNLRKEIEEKWNEVESCARMVDYMIEAEHQVYQYTCDIINYHLSSIMRELFVDPIEITVKTTKITAKNREKPSINIYAICDGNEINIGDLSGGEKERCSMAMTLAMMQLSKSPVIILDETFSALGDEDREKAIQVLNRYGRKSDRTTLCVSHGGSTGWYDIRYECNRSELH